MLARLDLIFDAAGLVLGDPLSASQGGERKAVEPAEDGIEKVLDLPQRKEAIAHFLWIMRPQGQGADEVANLTRLGVVAGPKALHDCLEEEARVERVMQQEIDLRLQKASERFATKYQGRLDELNQYALELARLKKEVNMVKELIDKQPMLIEERKQNLAQLQNKLVFTQGDSKARFQAMQQNALNLYDQRRAMMGLLEQISQVEKELRGLESKAGN
jgi:ATP-dependent Clp protease ATP-binding subunit ClpA